MTASRFAMDIADSRRRTRQTMAASVVLHALLFLWIIFHPLQAAESMPQITEITYLEPGDLAAAAAAAAPGPPSVAPRSSPGMMRSSEQDVRFTRLNTQADVAPDPQTNAPEDRLRSRLAALQRDALVPAQGPSSATAPSPAFGSGGLPGAIGGNGKGPVALSRGGTGTGTALELTRGGTGHGTAPALAATGLPASQREETAAQAHGEETARRSLAGASLAGPIADRAILNMTRPVYPEWAKRDAVEGSVTLYFVVRPDGSVKENVLVQKTAGFQDFDESARAALRTWRFEALRAGRTGEQWGTITFHFRLRDSG